MKIKLNKLDRYFMIETLTLWKSEFGKKDKKVFKKILKKLK